LIGIALEPTVKIHEAKALTCNLRKGGRTHRPAAKSQPNEVDRSQGGAVDRTQSEGEEMLHTSPVSGLLL
jgi:hypothetical protein